MPPIENKAVTQANRQIVAIASQSIGLLSKKGLPSIIPEQTKGENIKDLDIYMTCT